jgi:SPP1 gp7 family putative phage head morphogenesis protein
MTNSILLDAFQQKPAAAMEFLRKKGYALSWNWFDTWKDAHSKAFTVAKVAELDLLKDIRAMLDKAVADGITLAQFKKELKPRLQAKGWWGKKEMVNAETGEVTEYMAGSPRRLKTIYKTNLQTAYMAGRYKGQMDAAGDLPYIQYISVMDGKTTDTCRDMHGRVFRADDPIWNSLYPPNHWGCRARTRSLTKRMVEREGLRVESSDGRLVQREVIVGKGANARKETVTGLKLWNGKTFWAGAGWDYNPGKETWMPDLKAYNIDDARLFVSAGFSGPAYRQFIDARNIDESKRIFGAIPIAILPKKHLGAIKANTGVVQLSSDTLGKQAKEHPEITTQEYLQLQTILEQPDDVRLDRDRNLVFTKTIEGKNYYVAVKATRTGNGLFMTSMRLNREGTI